MQKFKKFADKAREQVTRQTDDSATLAGNNDDDDDAASGDDPPVHAQIVASSKEMAAMRTTMMTVAKRLNDYGKSVQGASDSGRKLSVVLSEAGMVHGDTELADALSDLARLQDAIDDMNGALGRDVREKLADPMQHFCRSDIDHAVKFKRERYDRARKARNDAVKRLANESARSRVDIAKMNELAAERDRTAHDYEAASDETKRSFERAEMLRELFMLGMVANNIELYRDFFESGMQLCEELSANVAEYQQAIRDKMTAYASNYTDMTEMQQQMAAIAPAPQSAGSRIKNRFSSKVKNWRANARPASGAADDEPSSLGDSSRLSPPKRAAGRIFGVSFDEALSAERAQHGDQREPEDGAPAQLPLVLIACVMWLESSALDTEGLFRLSGSQSQLNALRASIEKGVSAMDVVQEYVSDKRADPHAVAGLLKLFFREMEEPLMQFDMYETWMSCADEDMSVSEMCDALRDAVHRLPPANAATLAYLCRFLSRVAEHSDENKMAASNLSIVFAPNLLRKRTDNPFDTGDFNKDLAADDPFDSHAVNVSGSSLPDFGGSYVPPPPPPPEEDESESDSVPKSGLLIDLDMDSRRSGQSAPSPSIKSPKGNRSPRLKAPPSLSAPPTLPTPTSAGSAASASSGARPLIPPKPKKKAAPLPPSKPSASANASTSSGGGAGAAASLSPRSSNQSGGGGAAAGGGTLPRGSAVMSRGSGTLRRGGGDNAASALAAAMRGGGVGGARGGGAASSSAAAGSGGGGGAGRGAPGANRGRGDGTLRRARARGGGLGGVLAAAGARGGGNAGATATGGGGGDSSAPKQCAACREPIVGKGIKAAGRAFHRACFKCATCGGAFTPSDQLALVSGVCHHKSCI